MKCLICGNKERFKKLFPKFSKEKNYLCEECGLIFIPHEDSYLMNYYKDDGYFEKSPNKAMRRYMINKPLLKHLGKKRLKEFEDVIDYDFTNKDILDVGCGYGQFLLAIKDKYSCNATGVEPSVSSAEFGSERLDLHIEPILLEEFETDKKFDFIMANHTLEHVSDPNIFVESVKKLLKSDGYFYIEVPNVLRPTGNFHLSKFLYKEHLWTFNIYTLERLLNMHEFELIQYSDEGFLMALFRQSKYPESQVKPISSKATHDFLKEYHKNYNLVTYTKVYFGKFKYLLKIIYYKLINLLDFYGKD